MYMRKLLLFVAVLMIATTAAGFNAEINTVKEQASTDSPAEFQIEVENTANIEKRFSLSYEFSKASWVYLDNPKTIQPGEKENFTVTFSPDDNAVQNRYQFRIFVTDRSTNQRQSVTGTFRVLRQYDFNFLELNLDKDSYKPGEVITQTISVQNVAPRTIDDFEVRTRLLEQTKTEEGTTTIPGGQKQFTFTYSTEPGQPPGEQEILIEILQNGEVIQNTTQTLNIEENPQSTVQKGEEDRLIQKMTQTTVTNTGNVETNTTINTTIPNYLDPITVFNQPYQRFTSEEGETTYYWDVVLQPGEQRTITQTINYWIPLVVALILVGSLIAIKKMTGGIKFTKTVVEESDEDIIKVSITLENKTGKTHQNLEVTDYIPNVVQLDEEHEMTKPETKTKTEGTILTWSVDDFRPGEKRIIQYKVKPKVKVEGGITFKPAKLEENGEVIQETEEKSTNPE